MNTIEFEEFQKDPEKYIEAVKKGGVESIVITVNGKPRFELQPVKEGE